MRWFRAAAAAAMIAGSVQVADAGEWAGRIVNLEIALAQARASDGAFRLSVSPSEITISRAPVNPRSDPPRTRPSAKVVAVVTPPAGYSGGVTLGIIDTSYQQGQGIGWYPGYVSFFGGMITARSSPPWQQTIELRPPASPTPLGVHRCVIVITHPRGGSYAGEAALTVTVVDP